MKILWFILLLTIPLTSATTYFYADERMIAEKETTITMVYQDKLGSHTTTSYLPFGEIIVNTDRFGYTGKEQDTSELNNFIARYYDSELGRFTSKDPAQVGHEYTYTNNNPLRFIDPDGREVIEVNHGWRWYVPTTGSLVVDYVVQYKIMSTDGEYTSSWLTLPPEMIGEKIGWVQVIGVTEASMVIHTLETPTDMPSTVTEISYTVRIAGRDEQERQGMFSDSSDPAHLRNYLPVQPGKPQFSFE